jgi:hypothetical protein
MTDHDSPLSPFFIIGAQRSGTTMLRLMLNRHPRIAVPHESGFITDFYRRQADYGDLSKRENAARLLADISETILVKRGGLVPEQEAVLSHPISRYSDLAYAIFTEYAKRKGKARWGDKTPYYTTDLDILWRLFPGCHIVHVVRDGRDVALSMRSVSWATSNLPRAAEDWRWKTILAHKVGSVLGEHYMEIHYEELVLETERTLRSICEFLDETFHEDMLSYFDTADQEVPEESLRWHQTSIKAPDPTKVYSWKTEMSLSDRILFDEIVGDALELFGYERENHPRTLRSRLKGLYYGLINRW